MKALLMLHLCLLGCKGNGNRFSNVEDCVNTCGGSSDPVTHTEKCKHVQCDTAEANVRSNSARKSCFLQALFSSLKPVRAAAP